MKGHLEELKLGGRPMTKLEKANKEIERLQKENEILRHRLEVANEYIDSRKENMIIDHVIDLKYIINECDLDSTW